MNVAVECRDSSVRHHAPRVASTAAAIDFRPDERPTVQRSRAGNDGLVVDNPRIVFRGRARLDFPIALTGPTRPAVCQLPVLHRMHTLPARPHDGHVERATQWAFDRRKGSGPNFVHGPSVPAQTSGCCTEVDTLKRRSRPVSTAEVASLGFTIPTLRIVRDLPVDARQITGGKELPKLLRIRHQGPSLQESRDSRPSVNSQRSRARRR